MREKDFYRPVQIWAMKNLNQTAVIELKIVKNNSRFRKSDLRDHQIKSLLHAKHDSVGYKIPDIGMDQKPFDLCVWHKSLAFVGVVYYEPRKKKRLYLIDIDTLCNDSRSSFKEEELQEISYRQVILA